jgi:nitroreductase
MSAATDSRRAAFDARYGAGAIPPDGPWNEVIAALLDHRSVRAYRPDPLPDGTLETLVAAAQSAATSSNMQTWSVVSVTDPARKARLARIANDQRHIEQCPLFLVWLADLSRLARLAEGEGTALAALPFLETFLVAAIDASLAAQNATVAAESLGLSTVYIGALRNDVRAVAAELGLPPGCMAVFGLCVGTADQAMPRVKPRLPQTAVLHREQYDDADSAARAAYDEALHAWGRDNERAPYTWTQRVLARYGTTGALHGRDRLREALAELGFPLR